MLNTFGALSRAPEALLLGLQEDAGADIDGYFFTETWLRGDPLHLPGLQRAFGAPRSDGRGGVAGYVADSLHCRAAVWRRRAEDGVLWLRMCGVHGLPGNLSIAVCYLPPGLSSAAAASWFETLADESAQAMAAGLVLICGDFNGRTAEEPDTPDGNAVPPRRSADPVLAGHGRALLAFCHTTGLLLCNGRVAGDVPAQPTSRGQRGGAQAVVDYFLACPQLFPLVRSLSVAPAPPAGGDHCHLRLDISLAPQGAPPPPPPPSPPDALPPDYTIVDALLPQVEAFMRSEATAAELQAVREAATTAGRVEEVEAAALQLQHVMCRVLETAGMQRRQPTQQPRRSRPWRSAELTRLRRQHRRAVRQRAWAEVARLSTLYRRAAQRERRQRQQMRGARLTRLLCDDPSAFFARFRTPCARASALVPKATWLQYFSSLLGEPPPALPVPPPPPAGAVQLGGSQGPTDTPPAASQPAAVTPEAAAALQAPFSTAEVDAAIGRTRNRAAVVGPLKPPVLKRVRTVMAPVLADLFNACARVGCLPGCWAVSAITPIPKTDVASAECSNYRGIAVGTLPAKLYAAALDRRLTGWAEGVGVRAEGQFGFRRKRSCAQAALVLRATIERCRARRQPLYAAFIDFQKAYDTVPRHLLWAKLEAAGVGGWCLRAVQALYADVPMCVRTAEGCTETFQSLLGVKQGCPLSPTLFCMFVDDLAAAVAAEAGAELPCLRDGRPVPPLLYADDLACLATTPAGLQHQLDRLEAFAASWGLTVNVGKTKVVVFEGQQRRAAPASAQRPPNTGLSFTYGGAAIDTVDEFRYLGIQFHRSRAFAAAAAARATAGGSAMHAVRRRCAELGLRGARVQLQLFNAMVLPVLSYGAEIWSPQLIATGSQCTATRVQLAYLRQLLGVRQSTPALVLLAETSQQPLVARWAVQVGRFWNSVLSADEASLVRRALHDSCALATEAGGMGLARQPWARQVVAALHAYGVAVDLHEPQPVDVSDIVEAAATSVRRQLSSAQGTRFSQYVAATGADAAEDLPGYLSTLQHRGRWRALAQLRTGSHWLAEETGRWQQQQRVERLCSHCVAAGERHVEDVEHALFQCPRAAQLRAQYPLLFTPAHTQSVYAFFTLPDSIQLSSFCTALHRLYHPKP